jgi:3-deoxy-7-phosphoheptulonate synthase
LSHLPIVIDPSHGTGRRDGVAPMTKAAIAAGADAVMIEVHDDPERALSDGAQSLSLEAFEALMKDAGRIADACGRPFEGQRVVAFKSRG